MPSRNGLACLCDTLALLCPILKAIQGVRSTIGLTADLLDMSLSYTDTQ